MSEKYLKNRDYTLRGGKEAEIAMNRHRMEQEQYNSKQAFVKKQQAEVKSMQGRPPKLEERDMHFDACMMNEGEHAQEYGRSLTAGLDKKAYPVK